MLEYLTTSLTLRMTGCVSPQLAVDLLWSARLADYFSASFYESVLGLVEGCEKSKCEFHLNHIILIAR